MPLIQDIQRREGKFVVGLKVDNGPDQNLKSLANFMSYGRLFRDSNSDMLVVTAYNSHKSRYNDIEHAWSPTTNHLTGVLAPATLPDETLPPFKQSALSKEEVREKEIKVFDNAIEMFASHWRGKTYDGWPMIPIGVPSDPLLEKKTYKDHDLLLDFTHEAGINRLKVEPHLRSMNEEFLDLVAHSVRGFARLQFVKCQAKKGKVPCKRCASNPPHSPRVFDYLRRQGASGRLASARLSTRFPSHYYTFLEEMMATTKNTLRVDELCPTIVPAIADHLCQYGCDYVRSS
jgi:hypothetical protein